MTGRDDPLQKIKNIPAFYEVKLSQVAPRAPQALIAPRDFKSQLAVDRVEETPPRSHSTMVLNQSVKRKTLDQKAMTQEMFRPRIKIKKSVAAAVEQKYYLLEDD